MTDAEINAAVAEKVCGMIAGKERDVPGKLVSGWFSTVATSPTNWRRTFWPEGTFTPATRWDHAMMAAETWMRGDNGRRVKLHCGLHPRGGIRAAVTLHALEDKPGRGFGDGPRALCLALLQAAGETETETEKQ